MEKQLSFAQAEYEGKKRVTRRAKFLGEMEEVVPWERLVGLIEPHYPKSGGRGRPPLGLEKMLRMYFLQQWYGLADEALEDEIYESRAMIGFLGLDTSRENVPDATTLLHFRHLLERHGLQEQVLEEVSQWLAEKQLIMKEGTLVDATIIAAPSSTKNQQKQRDPAMKQTRKGNQWHFGMKAHIGVDRESGRVHRVVGTAANQSDISQTHKLLHGEEEDGHGDAGYQGAHKRPEVQAANPGITWHIAAKRGQIKKMKEGQLKDKQQEIETLKAKIRAKVEHPFHIVKNLFQHRKVRYRGLAKNTGQLHVLFALANLVMAARVLRHAT